MDTSSWPNPYRNPNPYIPASLGEILDYLTGFCGGVPGFTDKTGLYPDDNVDTCFDRLDQGCTLVRAKLGEERYAAVTALATRIKALFLEDPEDTNGKTHEGVMLVHEIDNILTAVRSERATKKLPDEEGELSGD